MRSEYDSLDIFQYIDSKICSLLHQCECGCPLLVVLEAEQNKYLDYALDDVEFLFDRNIGSDMKELFVI